MSTVRLPRAGQLKQLVAWILSVSIGYAAANSLEQIRAVQEGPAVAVTLQLAQPPGPDDITHFTTTDPARLVVDLADTRNDSGLTRLTPASPLRPLLAQVALASDTQRTRLQFDLGQTANHALQVHDRQVRIVLQPATTSPAAEDGGLGHIGGILFERGSAGQARLRVALPSAQSQVRLRQVNQQLIADIAAVALPAELAQRQTPPGQDTPLRRFTVLPHDGGARIVIETRGQWRYEATQSGRELLLELHALEDQASAPLPISLDSDSSGDDSKPPEQRRISLNFHDIDVRTALQMLADFSGTNIVAADSVNGQLSLRLHEQPWEQVLQLILQARGLGVRRHGEVLWIAPRDELLARERMEREQQHAIDELAPLHARAYQLNYQRADTLRRMLGAGEDGAAGSRHATALLSRRGSAMADNRTNQLFVTDTLAALDNVSKMLERIDVAARQVLIEARIVEADDSFGRELGVKLGLLERGRGLAVGDSLDAVRQTSGQTGSESGGGTGADHAPALSLPAASIAGAKPAAFALTLFNAAAHRFLNIELSALEANGRGRIVASPRVVTADQKAALIEQGEEIPYQQSIGSGASSTAFKKANLKLEVTPQITPDGHVILEVDVNKDSRGAATPSGLAINTKHVRTQVQVEDGGTVVIGGIYTQTDAERETRVPLLGDIPLLGALFRHRSRISEKTELMIFLTPRVVGHQTGEAQFSPEGGDKTVKSPFAAQKLPDGNTGAACRHGGQASGSVDPDDCR